MFYEFPYITHIDTVLNAIKDCSEIVCSEKNDYFVINYYLSSLETFPEVVSKADAIRRECRGLIFDKTGRLIRRPLHKFFNINERDETADHKIDIGKPHMILEKLDGSMIVPFIINDNVLWGTKMGHETDVAKQAAEFVSRFSQYDDVVRRMKDFSLIFEWCSNKQRIVIDHPREQLVLVAAREIYAGGYVQYGMLKKMSEYFNIPVVNAFDPLVNLTAFVNTVKSLEETEGRVIRFHDGHMLKVKSDWYVSIHKNKEMVAHEKNVVQLIMGDQLDDVMPLLALDVDRDRVLTYTDQFKQKFSLWVDFITIQAQVFKEAHSRKEFALTIAPGLNPILRGIYFAVYEYPSTSSVAQRLRQVITKATTGRKFMEVKEVFFKDLAYE